MASSGTGVPHLRSRVMQRGLRPSLSQPLVIWMPFVVQWPGATPTRPKNLIGSAFCVALSAKWMGTPSIVRTGFACLLNPLLALGLQLRQVEEHVA